MVITTVTYRRDFSGGPRKHACKRCRDIGGSDLFANLNNMRATPYRDTVVTGLHGSIRREGNGDIYFVKVYNSARAARVSRWLCLIALLRARVVMRE